MTLGTAIVIAKEPLPGKVKTRLTPPLTHEAAAAVAGAALRDTVRTIDAVPADHRLLAFAGDATDWTPPGWRAIAQPDGGLDVRLAAAFAAAPAGPALLVGMDTPQLRPEHLAPDWTGYDACLGLATDGGFWAIGFRDPSIAAAALPGVPMSTPRTGAAQLDRLRSLGLRVRLLDELTDVDTVESAFEVAELAPHTAFAAEWRRQTALVAG